jgi:hypothetical protein
MNTELSDFCEATFGKYFDTKLQENLVRKRCREGRDYAELPVLGGWHLIEQIAQYRTIACRALIVQAQFEWEKPDWAPRLPTSAEEIDKLQHNTTCRLSVVGHYAESRQGVYWGPHPGWDAYCAGLCALPDAIKFMRHAGLETRPRRIEGLDPQTWRLILPLETRVWNLAAEVMLARQRIEIELTR